MVVSKNQRTVFLLLDLALLFFTPLVLGIGSAMVFFFFYPLPAVIIALVAHRRRRGLVLQKLTQALRYPLWSARLIILGIFLYTLLIPSTQLPSFATVFSPETTTGDGSFVSQLFLAVSTLLYGLILLSTYCAYFSYHYKRPAPSTPLELNGVFYLEFYLFILAYIILILGLQTFFIH